MASFESQANRGTGPFPLTVSIVFNSLSCHALVFPLPSHSDPTSAPRSAFTLILIFVIPTQTKNFRTGEQHTWTGSFTRVVSPKGFFIDLRFPERDVSSFPPKLDQILSKLWKKPCTSETSEKPCTIWVFAGFRSPDKPIPAEYMSTGLVEFQAYSKWCVRKLHDMPCSSKYQVAMKGSTHMRVKNWSGDFSLEDEALLASAQKIGGFVAVLNPRGVHRDVGPFPLWDEILAESTAKDDRGIVIRVGRLMVGLFISGAGKMSAFKVLYEIESDDLICTACGPEFKDESEAKARLNFPIQYFENPLRRWRVGELELVSESITYSFQNSIPSLAFCMSSILARSLSLVVNVLSSRAIHNIQVTGLALQAHPSS